MAKFIPFYSEDFEVLKSEKKTKKRKKTPEPLTLPSVEEHIYSVIDYYGPSTEKDILRLIRAITSAFTSSQISMAISSMLVDGKLVSDFENKFRKP